MIRRALLQAIIDSLLPTVVCLDGEWEGKSVMIYFACGRVYASVGKDPTGEGEPGLDLDDPQLVFKLHTHIVSRLQLTAIPGIF